NVHMTRQQPRRSRLYQVQLLALVLSLLLIPLAACDSTPLGSSSSAGSAGISGFAGIVGTSGSSGSHQGATVTFPSTTKIVVQFPHGAGGTSSGGGSASGGPGGAVGSAGSAAVQCVPDQPSGTDTGVCGDGFRSSTEACDDGNTLPGDGCSPTCEITPQLVSARFEALGTVTRINAGSGETFGSFSGDDFFVGGWDAIPGAGKVIDTSGVVNPAPQEVYQSERW